MKNRSRAYNRRMSYLKARRKQRLDNELSLYPCYKNLHQYSKNKIHCSCPLCAAKTRTNGWNIKDLRRIEAMNQSIND